MNAEVEIHVGSRPNVLAIPNAALRTQRDVGSAAGVLGLDPEAVLQQVADARRQRAQPDSAARGATPANGAHKDGEKFTTPEGREITLPPGLKAAQVTAALAKIQSGGFQSLSAEDRAVMQQFRTAAGIGSGGRGGRGFVMREGGGLQAPAQAESERPRGTVAAGSDYLFGGDYIVFVTRGGQLTPVPIRTGLTDLDYSEVVSGLTEQDTVLILPSVSLIRQQQEQQERSEMMRNAMPGVQPMPGGRR
jgi:hypothetical protein